MPRFIFPEVKFARTNTAGEQLEHVFSEVDEIQTEIEGDGEITDFDAVHREVADLHHSLETFWRILERTHGPEYVSEIFRQVEEKNRERDYYGFEGCGYALAGLEFEGWEDLEPHPDDLFGWIDPRTEEVVYLMEEDGYFVVTPCADDAKLKVLVRKDAGK